MLKSISFILLIILVGHLAGTALGGTTGDRYVHAPRSGSRLNVTVVDFASSWMPSPVVLPNRYPVLIHRQTSIFDARTHLNLYSQSLCECCVIDGGEREEFWGFHSVHRLEDFVGGYQGSELDCSPCYQSLTTPLHANEITARTWPLTGQIHPLDADELWGFTSRHNHTQSHGIRWEGFVRLEGSIALPDFSPVTQHNRFILPSYTHQPHCHVSYTHTSVVFFSERVCGGDAGCVDIGFSTIIKSVDLNHEPFSSSNHVAHPGARLPFVMPNPCQQ